MALLSDSLLSGNIIGEQKLRQCFLNYYTEYNILDLHHSVQHGLKYISVLPLERKQTCVRRFSIFLFLLI
jgi:hypothetical protein